MIVQYSQTQLCNPFSVYVYHAMTVSCGTETFGTPGNLLVSRFTTNFYCAVNA